MISEEKRQKILNAARAHEQRCEDLWYEMIWELAMHLGLTEKTVERTLEKG